MRIDILTIFPEMFAPVLGASILKIAAEKKLVGFQVHDIRDFADDPRRTVDDRPYGGGPGMLMMPGPVCRAVEWADAQASPPARRILLSPIGERFTQKKARELAGESRLMLLAGRYEGFDERIRSALAMDEVSIGDYVLSGGELAAMVVIEAVVRLIPGVLGSEESLKDESFAGGVLDYPQYTRPVEFRGMKVPEVLLSGNHGKIAEWRRREAVERTRRRRPDLLQEPDKDTER